MPTLPVDVWTILLEVLWNCKDLDTIRMLSLTDKFLADASRPLLFRTIVLDIHRPGEAERLIKMSKLLNAKNGSLWTKILHVLTPISYSWLPSTERAVDTALLLLRQLRSISTVHLSGVMIISIFRYLVVLPSLKKLVLHSLEVPELLKETMEEQRTVLLDLVPETLSATSIHISGLFPTNSQEQGLIFELLLTAKGLTLLDVMQPHAVTFLFSQLSQSPRAIPTLNELRITVPASMDGQELASLLEMCPNLNKLTLHPVSGRLHLPCARIFEAFHQDIVLNLNYFEGPARTAAVVVLRRPIRELVLVDRVIDESSLQKISTSSSKLCNLTATAFQNGDDVLRYMKLYFSHLHVQPPPSTVFGAKGDAKVSLIIHHV
jgi:hypothetical protein